MWGGHVLFIPIGIKKSCIPFSEIPINTSSDMVLGCGFSFLPISSRETYVARLKKWKLGFFWRVGYVFLTKNTEKEIPET